VAQDPDKATGDSADEPVLPDAQAVDESAGPDALDGLDEHTQALLTEAEQVAASVAMSRPTRKAATATDTIDDGKGRPTPKQQRAAKTREHKHAGPIQFIKESIEELRKVNWPTLDTWQQYFIVVLVFVVIIIAIVSLLDYFFGWALLAIFG